MKKLFLTIFAVSAWCFALYANSTPRWIRSSCISPDGKNIAFAYQGNIFVVPAEGGNARQLTSNAAYESDPLWSPDSKTVVFKSLREGSFDIWAIPLVGGNQKADRLPRSGKSALRFTGR